MKAKDCFSYRDARTGEALTLMPPSHDPEEEREEGELRAPTSGAVYLIRQGIPRFVSNDGYTAHFGDQWNRYRRTQLDSVNGTRISTDRLFQGTQWKAEELRGQRILEVGCGAGRFTEVLLAAGADVWSIDYSTAVDACRANIGDHPLFHCAQADLFALPFEKRSFDRVFCYGVLQHTPDPHAAFLALTEFLKPGGRIAIDSYVKTFRLSRYWRPSRWSSKYLYRWLTTRLPHRWLRGIIAWYIPRWIPWENRLRGIPILRAIVPLLIPCWNYTGILPLNQEQISEWAILDTFDALGPTYDQPQKPQTIAQWFREAALEDIDIRRGGNGIVGNGKKAVEVRREP